MSEYRAYVKSISYEGTEPELLAIAKQFGGARRVKLPKDFDTDRIKGYGFVECDSETDLEKIIKGLNDYLYHGRALVAEEARPRGY